MLDSFAAHHLSLRSIWFRLDAPGKSALAFGLAEHARFVRDPLQRTLAHRALSLAPPERRRSSVAAVSGEVHLHRRDRLDGAIHEHILAA